MGHGRDVTHGKPLASDAMDMHQHAIPERAAVPVMAMLTQVVFTDAQALLPCLVLSAPPAAACHAGAISGALTGLMDSQSSSTTAPGARNARCRQVAVRLTAEKAAYTARPCAHAQVQG